LVEAGNSTIPNIEVCASDDSICFEHAKEDLIEEIIKMIEDGSQ